MSKRQIVCFFEAMKPNGPAIKGGCVTRRKHRAVLGTLAAKWSRCQEGMARVFAVMAGANWVIRVSRYTVDKWPVNCLGSKRLVNGHRRSVAVQV
jgi:hypothetical protein